jgi:hypothetical protein
MVSLDMGIKMLAIVSNVDVCREVLLRQLPKHGQGLLPELAFRARQL